ncbi:MAG: hypothetical protein KC421_12190, partial [Anaerolineales bacterium]|nr:hypothetical protein [Anaerolineales bacterium]
FENSYRVTVTYITETGGRFTRDVAVGRRLFAELAERDEVSIHTLPRWPDKGVLADPYLMAAQARLLLWSSFVLIGWAVGAVVKQRERAQAIAAAAAPPIPPLHKFNLDTWLTAADDFDLWQTLLAAHFPDPDDETVHLPGLRCGVGQPAPDARFRMQPSGATCFEWDGNGRIRPTPCSAEPHTDADHDPALAPLIPLQVITIQKLPRDNRPYHTILVERPSVNRERVLVYTAVYRKNGRGSGKTTSWVRQPDGTWHDTGERLNWWYEG